MFNLSALLDDIYGAGPDRPALVGPDASGFHVPLPDSHSVSVIAYIQDYLTHTQSILRAITHHEVRVASLVWRGWGWGGHPLKSVAA